MRDKISRLADYVLFKHVRETVTGKGPAFMARRLSLESALLYPECDLHQIFLLAVSGVTVITNRRVRDR
jgi:hypothetical protein